ncbi:MAG: PEGA domain-containing protein [Phycisphaerales bacterium]|nr:MAG: PEGA domain-containing protein [Phycisphaerales bacterium]
MPARPIVLLIGLLSVTLAVGCVRRTMSFNTDPQGAIVHLNDVEIGRTPVTVDFTWYGDYDVVYRKEGYTTLVTHHRVREPWYQLFPLDFFSEVLIPWEIHDHQEIPLAVLDPEPDPDVDALVQRADEMRDQAVYAED